MPVPVVVVVAAAAAVNTIGKCSIERMPGVYTSVWPGLDRVLGDAPVPLAQRDPQLQAGEVRAEAAVHAAAEREVAVDLAVEAHVVGVGELGLVGVGRRRA